MSKTIKLKRGFDINLAGKPVNKISKTVHAETYALKPSDFPHLSRPKLSVNVGDKVKAGTPIMFDKMTEAVKYCAPVSGEIIDIKRGEKRKILEVVIKPDAEVAFEKRKSYSKTEIASLTKEQALTEMQEGGVWPNVIQRPFGTVANAEDAPKAIFISGFDTNPLAADITFQLQDREEHFLTGLEILKKLTSGLVHLNIDSNSEVPKMYSLASGVEMNKFSGAHPAGNVGVQIHHLDPISKGQIAWTVSPIGVAQIGQLFLEGIYNTSKIVAIAGSEVTEPSYVKTFSGAHITSLVEGATTGSNLRFISGNPLTGENSGKDGFLGFYHSQVTVIPEGDYEEFLGWIKPSTSKLSFHKAIGLFSFLSRGKEYKVDTNTHGEDRPFVVSGQFEKVLPMDILPTYLFKAIIAEDYDDMEALGIYELIEEDVALCEFIDPSKNELQVILRRGLDLIKNS
jgi:Na+-transporting NADH:ubiquinone oxidoreductase subunit A